MRSVLVISIFFYCILFSPSSFLFAQTSLDSKSEPIEEEEVCEDICLGEEKEYRGPTIENFREDTMNRHFFNEFVAYKAVRLNDLSICEKSGEIHWCKDCAKRLLMSRRIGEERCGEINNEAFKEICVALQKRDCPSLSGWKKRMCDGFLTQDLNLVKEAIYSSGYERNMEPGDRASLEDAHEIMACFLGFKAHNQEACEEIAKKGVLGFPERFLCEIIFSQDDVDEILDRFGYDYSYFTLSRHLEDKNLCNLIKNKEVKDACFRLDIKQGARTLHE
ncbi:MAG: hypothetical protein ISS47_07755 [Candidatus Omnitrophica bacterium]|nr:hypothetical protein [Candidatus Omnitrophota bacterium]